MVTAFTPNPKQQEHRTSRRQPLLSSDSNNAPPSRRPKAREVTSRYLSLSTSSSSSSNSNNTTSSSVTSASSISSIRCHSPLLRNRAAINTTTTTPKSQQRAVSAERRRTAAANVKTPSNAERMLATSLRSLSVSFQGESYSFPVSKVRKDTPERRRTGVTPVRDRENSRPSDNQKHRWPGRLREENSNFLTRSLDYGAERVKLSGSGAALKDLSKSMADGTSGNTICVKLKHETNNSEIRELDPLNSDTVSVQLRGIPRGIVVPPRYKVNKVLDPASPVSKNALSRIGPSKLIAKKFQNDSPVSSPREVITSRGLSPLRGGVRAASPCKAFTPSNGAMLRGMASPIRNRCGVANSSESNMCSTPSILSFANDVRRGKLGENRIADAHDLRILYNRQLQWRFANARVENALSVQKHTSETSLYNAWVTTSRLRNSVKSKRVKLQLLRHNMKLYSILKDLETPLENWGLLDRDHCNSVSGAIEALEANTLRLPIVGGARVDVQKVKEAISSAVDTMQTMASSICSLLTKVEQMNLVVSELSNLSSKERALLNECRDLLSTTLIPLQVTHCSLTTHLLQVHRLPSLTKKYHERDDDIFRRLFV
ncbi:hypothetical protein ACJIZ3_025069 [Penstemon smallii]|uniref:QWRF motif-containing protein 2 n=1 Tax=Penstemon smallii TaxID=265156 RepID=A0ABD3TW68_9LAMI